MSAIDRRRLVQELLHLREPPRWPAQPASGPPHARGAADGSRDGSANPDRSYTVGPRALNLHLSVAAWAADGLLAIFFFVAGLELKRQFVVGDLRDPRRAAVPIAATVGGWPSLLCSTC